MNQPSALIIADLITHTVKEVTGKAPEWFLGGSHRFGWTTEESDVDVVVSTETPSLTATLLIDSGFFSLDRENAEDYHSVLLATQMFGHHVHVILVDQVQFARLSEEHDQIDQYLVKHPEILPLIQGLREQTDIKGSYIFRALLKVSKQYMVGTDSAHELPVKAVGSFSLSA